MRLVSIMLISLLCSGCLLTGTGWTTSPAEGTPSKKTSKWPGISGFTAGDYTVTDEDLSNPESITLLPLPYAYPGMAQKERKTMSLEERERLGLAFFYGNGVQYDLESASNTLAYSGWPRTFYKEATKWSPHGQVAIGLISISKWMRPMGKFPEVLDYWHWTSKYCETAEEILMMASKVKGDPYADMAKAIMFLKLSRHHNPRAGVAYLLKAARQGAPLAVYMMGRMFYHGVGVKKDYDLAFRWVKKAAESGIPQAYDSVALFYSHGDGCEKNFKESVIWNLKAADRNYPTAVRDMKKWEEGKSKDKVAKYVKEYRESNDRRIKLDLHVDGATVNRSYETIYALSIPMRTASQKVRVNCAISSTNTAKRQEKYPLRVTIRYTLSYKVLLTMNEGAMVQNRNDETIRSFVLKGPSDKIRDTVDFTFDTTLAATVGSLKIGKRLYSDPSIVAKIISIEPLEKK